MKKFFIKTLGCKTNQLESAILEEKMEKAGYVSVADYKECDIFILNSCSVTQNSDNESLRLINHVKNFNEKIFTVLTGCFAQLSYKELSKNSNIDLLLGNDDKFNIVEHINNKESCVTDIMDIKNFNTQNLENLNRTRANLKIQDGCNNRCSYCTIPLARGYSRSNSIENIINQIEILSKNDFKEIILTGIHIGQWGEDFSPKLKLLNLLEKIETTNIVRYRLGSLNPLEIDMVLLEFLKNSEKFCPHFHLSLQSANNKILKLMNRQYTTEKYLEQIKHINTIFKNPFLGCDIIVGFPNETDEDFEITYNNLKNSGLSKIHVFPYSKRPNTVAYKMDNQVNEKDKKLRSEKLKELSDILYMNFVNSNINTNQEVIFQKRFDKNGYLKGLTRNYMNIIVKNNDKKYLNTLSNVKIKEIENSQIIGEII